MMLCICLRIRFESVALPEVTLSSAQQCPQRAALAAPGPRQTYFIIKSGMNIQQPPCFEGLIKFGPQTPGSHHTTIRSKQFSEGEREFRHFAPSKPPML